MEKHFDPTAARQRWNREWDARGVFRPDDASSKPNFVIVLPPPNVTGVLHVGHILGDTVQDHLIRWKHMRGFNTLWLPGTDHAGIATQKVVEAALVKQGRRRSEMTRDEFVAEAWKWKEHHHARIVEQMKQLGCAFDWSREAFTLDELRSRAVRVKAAQTRELDEEPTVSGEEVVHAELGLRAVERALATLAPEQRAVLTLVAVEGLSYREAAEVLDTPIGTVMSRLARARAALAERLGAGDGENHG